MSSSYRDPGESSFGQIPAKLLTIISLFHLEILIPVPNTPPTSFLVSDELIGCQPGKENQHNSSSLNTLFPQCSYDADVL